MSNEYNEQILIKMTETDQSLLSYQTENACVSVCLFVCKNFLNTCNNKVTNGNRTKVESSAFGQLLAFRLFKVYYIYIIYSRQCPKDNTKEMKYIILKPYTMGIFQVYLIINSFSVISSNLVCQVALKNDFNICNNRADELIGFANYNLNRVYNTSQSTNQSEECIHESLCRHVFKVARIRRQNFASKSLVRISDMLFRCCGQCAKYYRHDIHSTIPALNLSKLNSFDMIYPILGKQSDKELYGFHYIPVFEIPTAYYFTLKKSKEELANDLIMSCFNLWPLTLASLCLSFIAGFIIWLIEASTGNEQFPKDFGSGLVSGVWWSFITATTVGYGDKCPKHIFGRIFSAIWICVGVVIMAIFVASLSSEIMIQSTPGIPEIKGRLIGGLEISLSDAVLVSQHGGDYRAVASDNGTVLGIGEMFKMLKKKEIDGLIINKSTYFYFSRILREKAKYKELASFVKSVDMMRTEKAYTDREFVTGILVKHEQHYEFFKRYFESNWLQIQTCYKYSLNYKDVRFQEEPGEQGLEGLLAPFTTWILAGLGFIGVFGIVYEVWRRREQKEAESDRSFEHLSRL